MQTDTSQRPHRGLHGLRAESIDCVERAIDVADAEPVGQTNDCPQVAGVLHIVKGETQFLIRRAPVLSVSNSNTAMTSCGVFSRLVFDSSSGVASTTSCA